MNIFFLRSADNPIGNNETMTKLFNDIETITRYRYVDLFNERHSPSEETPYLAGLLS